MRAFFAVNLDSCLLAEIGEIQKRLQKISGIRWVNPGKMHITLYFLGEITLNQVREVEEILQGPAQQFSPFYISFRGAGVFPNKKNPRVLWLGIDKGASDLRAIHTLIQNSLPFIKTENNFTPHLTLGRRKKNARMILDEDIFSEEIACQNRQYVDRFYLMRSTLYSTGPVYEPLKEFLLNI